MAPADVQRNRARERLVRLAKAEGVPLRQSYVRVGPRLLFKNNRYGYARQTRRMRRTTAKLKTVLGRVYRDLERKLVEQPEAIQAAFVEEMAKRSKKPAGNPDPVRPAGNG